MDRFRSGRPEMQISEEREDDRIRKNSDIDAQRNFGTRTVRPDYNQPLQRRILESIRKRMSSFKSRLESQLGPKLSRGMSRINKIGELPVGDAAFQEIIPTAPYSRVRPSTRIGRARARVQSSLLVLKNVWFQRSMYMVFLMVSSVLLLVYSYTFLYTYEALNNTTSYFPWAWMEHITDSATVQSLFFVGFEISISLLSISSALLFVLFLPSFRRSLRIAKARRESWERTRGRSLGSLQK